MNNELLKAKKILDELIDYFWHNSIYQLNINFQPQDKVYIIEVSGYCSERPADLDELTKGLNQIHHPEMEEYYDQLLGNSSDIETYHLLGAIIDKAEVTYQQQILKVKIIKNR